MTHVEHTPEATKLQETAEGTAVSQNTPDNAQSAAHVPDIATASVHHLYTYPGPEEHYPKSDLNRDVEENPALYWDHADF